MNNILSQKSLYLRRMGETMEAETIQFGLTRFFEYLVNNEMNVLERLKIVRNAAESNYGIYITFTPKLISHRIYINGSYITEMNIYQFIDVIQHVETVCLSLAYKERDNDIEYLSILEDNDFIPHLKDNLMSERSYLLKEAERIIYENHLLLKIDNCLLNGDREKFIKYTNEYINYKNSIKNNKFETIN